MNKEVEYWKWKNTIIDFDNISDEKDEYGSYATKKDIVFHYLGTPDNNIHEWYNGGFSSEYNTALRYAKQLGLVEDYIDYEEELYKLKQENKRLHNKIDKAIEILKEHFVEEYIRSCDTSDGVGRYEIDTEHWTYKVYEQLKDSDVDE